MTLFPEIRWAQRSSETEATKNVLFLTVVVANLKTFDGKLTSNGFKFTGSDGTNEYAIELELYAEIEPELSHHTQNGQGVVYVIRKKEMKAEFWPRLTKEAAKKPYIRTDFDKWVDEDEQDEVEEEDPYAGMGGMPGMPGMPGMGGMPDMGGMGGMGGPGGFDMSQLLGGMGGAGGAGGDFDLEKLKAMAGEMGDLGGEDAEGDDDEEQPSSA